MRKILVYSLILGISFLGCRQNEKQIIYPFLKNEIQSVERFGFTYENQFQNLEDFESKKENLLWLRKQDSIAEAYFKTPEFTSFINRHRELNSTENDRPKMIKRLSNGKYYYTKDIDSSAVLYLYDPKVKMESVVFDSSDFQQSFNLSHYEPSLDGKHIMMTSLDEESGEMVFVFDVIARKLKKTGFKDFSTSLLAWVQWLPDNNLLYTGFPTKNSYNGGYVRLYNIKSQKSKIIYSKDAIKHEVNSDAVPIPYTYSNNPEKIFVYEATASEHYDCYSINLSSLQMSREKYTWDKTFDVSDSIVYYSQANKSSFYFKQIKNGKIVLASTPFSNPEPKNSKVVIRAIDDRSIDDFSFKTAGLFYTLSDGVTEELFLRKDSTDISRVPLTYPIGNIEIKNPEKNSDFINIVYEGWDKNLTETIINCENEHVKIVEKFGRKNIEEFNDVQVEVFDVESYDGVMVPVTVIKPKNYEPNEKSKGIVLAYGAYGYSLEAYYDSMLLDFVMQNNVVIVAHIRGGGEKGHNWYIEGIKDKKINSWKDLIACSEYAKSNIINKNERLGILVESAGGISAGMAINERPDLFNAMSGINLTLNPIRIGGNPNYTPDDNLYDFGTTETKEGLMSLLALDPVLNINMDSNYPAIYLQCGDKDELIPLSEPAKYIAILQSIQRDYTEPILLNVNYGVGHSYEDYTVDFGKALFFLNQELSR